MANPYSAGQKYNNPHDAPSTVGGQQYVEYHLRKAIIDARHEQYFSQLSDTTHMPKHFGKKITVDYYLPVIDDRNINDMGIDASGVTGKNGNLYGSTRDVGSIADAMPMLGEEGGRVNRVGSIRITLEGKIGRMGIFREWTDESEIFDSDPELQAHMQRELITAAYQLSEDMVQIELLQAADTIVYAGIATKDADVTGEGASVSEVSYSNLSKLDNILVNLRCPRNTKMVVGSAFTDTRTIPGCRVAYISTDLEETFNNMTDNFGKPAFIPLHQYAAATQPLRGEVGQVGKFRLISTITMAKWEGKGAKVTTPDTIYRNTNGKYDIYPLLVVGQESFTHIGFDAPGNKNKFNIYTRFPKDNHSSLDPYGETGFSSIKWYYGILPLRNERLAIIKTVARI